MGTAVNNFTVLESVYGRFVINRHCPFQPVPLLQTGRPHNDAELQVMLKIVGTLPAGCVIVDAGAHIGLMAIPIAQAIKEKRGTVHAFEVQRMIYYALCGSIALNDLPNIHAYQIGLGAEKSILKVPFPDYGLEQNFGALSLVEQGKIQGDEVVEIVTIDGLNLPRLDFLKIDVEGMETEVLKGARQMIKTHQPWCWVEYWKVGADVIQKQFADLDYKFYAIASLDILCAPVGRMKAAQIKIDAPEIQVERSAVRL